MIQARSSLLTVEEAGQLLGPREALIEYVFIDSLLAAFLITSDSFSVPIQIAPLDLRLQVEEFLCAIGHETDEDGAPTGSGRPNVSAISRVRDLGRRLYETLLRPIEEALPSRNFQSLERLVIVPHGVLHRLPLCALFDGSSYLAEKVPTTQVPSASLFRHGCQTRPRGPVPFTYFGLANPVPTDDLNIPGCEEVVMARAAEFGSGGWNGNLLGAPRSPFFAARGLAATPELLLQEAPHYSCVDLETHGRFTLGSPLEHRFLLAGPQGESWFTASDVFQTLRLRAELLVAALCHSGRLEIAAGDELLGLLRAFMFSGARSILLYPWVLVDDGAELFMNVFYRELVEGDGEVKFFKAAKDRAVRAAQMEFLSLGRNGQGPGVEKGTPLFDVEDTLITWEHPHYWAWILYGDHLSRPRYREHD